MHSQGRKLTLRDDMQALGFLAPFLIVFTIFIGYPLIYSLWISLHQVTLYSDFYDIFGTMNYVGAGNYTKVGTDPDFWWSVFLTFVYAALTIFPGMALSLALAIFLNKKIKGFGLMRSGFFLPNVFDIYVVGVIWLMIYNPQGGIIAFALRLFGIEEFGPLGNAYTTLPAIAFAMVLKNAGFGMILFLTSLNNMNESIFEAADVDGATPWQKLVHITLPLLRPIIFFLTITGMVGALNAFAEIYSMTDDTGGTSIQVGDHTLRSARISGYHLYKIFAESRYGEAAAISFYLLVIALILSFISYKVLKPRDN